MFPRLLALSEYHIMGSDIFSMRLDKFRQRERDSVEECNQT